MKGTGDNFYKNGQLLPENLQKAATEAGIQGLNLRFQEVSFFYHRVEVGNIDKCRTTITRTTSFLPLAKITSSTRLRLSACNGYNNMEIVVVYT